MTTSLIDQSHSKVAPPSGVVPWIKRNPLPVYFILAYALSWAIEVPIALSVQGVIAIQLPLPIHYFASFGPMLAAIIVAGLSDGAAGLHKLFAGLLKWRVKPVYALFALALPAALFSLAVIVSRLIEGAWPDLSLLGEADYLGRIGIPGVIGLWLLTFGFGEEVGWRGFALPRLQASRSAYSSALILGVLWAGWHLPAFFYRDTYTAMGLLTGFPMLLISVSAASVTMTWLYNSTQGSLLMIVLFHALFNFFSVSSAGGGSAPIVMSAVIVFWAVRAVKVYGPDTLAGPISGPSSL